MNALERAARSAWAEWAAYRKQTRCSSCGAWTYCGAKHKHGPWLCVDCHDLKGVR